MIGLALSILETDEQRNLMSEFYAKYKNRFYSIAYSYVRNKQSAEDAVQETFLRIANNPGKFFRLSGKSQVSYVDIIVRNIAVDMFKEEANRPEVGLFDNLDYEASVPLVDAKIMSGETESEIMAFIMSLPELQRDVLQLRMTHGLTNAEIAEQLGVSETSVRQRLYRARKAISERFGIKL